MIITIDDLKDGKDALDTLRDQLLGRGGAGALSENDRPFLVALIYLADSIRYATVVDLFLAGQSYRP